MNLNPLNICVLEKGRYNDFACSDNCLLNGHGQKYEPGDHKHSL